MYYVVIVFALVCSGGFQAVVKGTNAIKCSLYKMNDAVYIFRDTTNQCFDVSSKYTPFCLFYYFVCFVCFSIPIINTLLCILPPKMEILVAYMYFR